MNILIIFINNPNAIRNGKHDIRYNIFSKIAYFLKTYHNVYVSPCDSGTKLGPNLKNDFIHYNHHAHYQCIDLYICWYPYGGREKLFNFFRNKNVKTLCYENGWLNDSVLVDPKKMFSDSAYCDYLNDICQENYNNDKCIEYIDYVVKNNISKRNQVIIDDIPNNIKKKYIFVPTQKT